MTNHPRSNRALLALVAMLVAVFAALGWGASVSAHTEFDGSNPAKAATVTGPLSTVTVNFTNPAVVSGDGFELLEPGGTVRKPDLVDPTDGTAFVATFDPPLAAGEYGFRWDVQAGDSHPIQGSFKFTVAGGEPASPQAPATSVAATASTESTAAPVDHSMMSMHEFMSHDGTPSPFAGRAARSITMGSTVFILGVVAALVWMVRGRRDEIDRLLVWVRLAGLGIVTGGLIALASLEETHSSSLSDVVTTKAGIAALMAMAGGALVVLGFGSMERGVSGLPRSLSSAAITIDAVDDRLRHHAESPGLTSHSDQFRWRPTAVATPGLVGIALVVGAFWFDGHTVSRGPWVLHAVVNLVHVSAASVWVGGVFTMTLLAWMRRRSGNDTGLAGLVIRFSTIAAVSLVALSVAGLVMAWLVLDSPGDLFSTAWGRLLLIKVGAVAVAAGLGGYNHFALRPALESRPDDPDVANRLRASLSIESAIMVGVVVVTAVLVASTT